MGDVVKMMARNRDILTTGEVANICKVAPRTVSKWFDSGKLRGYRIPGSKDRRIPKAELLDFMDRHGIPHNGLASDKQTALAVGRNISSNNSHLEEVLARNGFELYSTDSAFGAGVLAERIKPRIIFWEIEAHRQNIASIAQNIRTIAKLPKTRVIALTNTSVENLQGDNGFAACLNLPADESRLEGLIAEWTVAGNRA